jgi:hypothetical protein
MSKVNTSFEERNIKSIENHLMRKVIASRSPSPGPGHYYGLGLASSLSNNLSQPSPSKGRTVTTSTVEGQGGLQAASPGRRGYTFGKTKSLTAVAAYDKIDHFITSVYEFKSAGNNNNTNVGGASLYVGPGQSGNNSVSNNSRSNSPMPLQRNPSIVSNRSASNVHINN